MPMVTMKRLIGVWFTMGRSTARSMMQARTNMTTRVSVPATT